MSKTNLLTNTKLHLAVILILTTLAYSNIFQNQLVVDDEAFLENWPDMQQFNIPKILQGSLPGTTLGVYRPVRSLLYAFYYHLSGPNPFIYHLHALLVHLISTSLIYLISLKLFKSNPPNPSNPSNPPLNPNSLSFITALLFGLHPIHTESITYISAALDTAGIAFLLSSFYLYLKVKEISPIGQIRLIRLITSVALATVAFFTNELALILPLLIIWYDYCFKHKSLKSPKLLKTYLPYFILLGIYLFTRFFIIHLNPSRGDYIAQSFYHTMIIMPQIFLKYIWLLIFPLKLSFIHTLAPGFETYMVVYSNFNSILNKHIYDLDIIIPIFILFLLIFLTIKYIKRYPLLCFSSGWFFISLLPVSYIVPVGPALSERYLYLPSFGFILLLVGGLGELGRLGKLGNKKLHTIYYILLTTLVAISYFHLTYQRNLDWKNPEALWRSVIRVYPDSLIANYNLSLAYVKNGQIDKTLNQYQKLLQFEPKFYEVRFYMANIYLQNNQPDLAKSEYIKVVQTNPNFLDAYLKLALIYQQEKDYPKAIETLKNSLKYDPYRYKILGNYVSPQKTANTLKMIYTLLKDLNDQI